MRENILRVLQKSKMWGVFGYSQNLGKYLKVFLNDGEMPIDNSTTY